MSRVLQRNPFLKQYTKTQNRSVHSFPYRRAVSRNQTNAHSCPYSFDTVSCPSAPLTNVNSL